MQCRPPRLLPPPRYRYQGIAYRLSPIDGFSLGYRAYPSALLTTSPTHTRSVFIRPETGCDNNSRAFCRVMLHRVSFLRSGSKGSINVSRSCKSPVVFLQHFAESQARQAGKALGRMITYRMRTKKNRFLLLVGWRSNAQNALSIFLICPKQAIDLLRSLSSRPHVPLLAPAAPPLARYCSIDVFISENG